MAPSKLNKNKYINRDTNIQINKLINKSDQISCNKIFNRKSKQGQDLGFRPASITSLPTETSLRIIMSSYEMYSYLIKDGKLLHNKF